MKKILGFLLLSFTFASSQSFAQTTIMRPAVAFVKATRDTLFIKQADSAVQAYDIASITKNVGSFILIDSVRHLAVIGMKPDGSRMILGGTFYYYNNSSSSHVSYQGLISIPWPLDQRLEDPTQTIQFLLAAPNDANFRPEGILSKDGSQWWATFQSYSFGQMTPEFYHGNTDGSGKIDSTTPENVQGADQLQGGVQFTNLALDTKTNTMLAMSFSGVQSTSQYSSFDIYFYSWSVGNDVQADRFTGQFKGEFVPTPSGNENPIVDSLFGLTVIPNNDGSTCLFGFTSHPNGNSINLYQTPYNAGNISLSDKGQIPDGILPAGQDFFSGDNCGPYQEAVATNGDGQPGNAGDMFVNSIGGDSVLFVTHESSNSCADRNAKSGIYYHDYTNTNDPAHLVYNDPNAQELQPVWVVMPYTVPQYPGIAWQGGTPNGNFGTVDTGKTEQLTFTVTDTSHVAAIIDSAHITGTNQSEITLAPVTYPVTLQPQGTQSFQATFAPQGNTGSRSALLTIYFEGKNSDMLTQVLNGTANDPLNSVANDPALSASMTTQPNPFAASAVVSLTAPEAGAMSIIVHDAVGRTVYRSDVREAGARETEAFTFDAKSLGLPDGVYYITAFLGDRQATREVVFAR